MTIFVDMSVEELRRLPSGVAGKSVGDTVEGLNDDTFRADCRSQAQHYFDSWDPSSLCQHICATLDRKAPLSLVRIGDGEGNVLRLSRYFDDLATSNDVTLFESRFISQNQIPFADDEALRLAFCNRMADAVAHADIIGARGVWTGLRAEALIISGCFDERQRLGGFGLLHARLFVEQLLRRHAMATVSVTHAHCHLAIMPHLDTLILHAERVIAISGRPGVKPLLEQLAGHRPVLFLDIPPEGGLPHSVGADHYGHYFQNVIDHLDTNLEGTLVLVGAGILGKIYCDVARNHGAVAIDFGSAFDLMAGLKTRPVHGGLFTRECLPECQRKGIVPNPFPG